MIKLSSLTPHGKNPRILKDSRFKLLCQSIKDFPEMMELRPLIVDSDGVILGGNMRYKALKHLAYKEIPDEWVKSADSLTEEQKREFMIKDNASFGGWDASALEGFGTRGEITGWGAEVEGWGDGGHPAGEGKKLSKFEDYDSFVDKFEVKKTTDDCYTSKEVMDAVVGWVKEQGCIGEDTRIVRPFHPGGDYKKFKYLEGDVVLDNPPFSIISEICRWYIGRGIKFFLFCPHLTAFGSDIDATHVISSSNIIYENGACVKTAFVSNMFGEVKVLGSHELHDRLEAINEAGKANLPRYEYPANVLTVSKIAQIVGKGVSITIMKNEAGHCRGLESQKKENKAVFGSGFLLSDRAAAAAAAAAAVEKPKTVWCLSEKEKNIIGALNK